jgi:seryl-tRNA synthetase
MHDIRFIRENPEAFDAALKRRGLEAMSAEIVKLDEERRAVSTALQSGLARRNEASKAIGAAMAQKDMATAEALKAEVATLKESLPAMEEKEREAGAALEAMLAAIPNLPADDVPQGADEADNIEVSRWGTPRSFDFTPQDHADFGPALGLDFEAAAAISGARFAALRGPMARLHRALAQFMLDTQTGQNGYEEVNPPLLVRDQTLYGTGQLPKFADDLFHTTDGRWLIPTAEVSLTNLAREQIVPDAQLPLRFTALTPCFRSEAGARAATRAVSSASTSSKRSSWSRSAARRTAWRSTSICSAARKASCRRWPPLSQGTAVHRRHGLRRAQDLRPRSLAAEPEYLPRDQLRLQLRRLPGAPHERTL